MELDENYSVEKDSYNTILKYSRTAVNSDGKEVVSTREYYYNCLKDCLAPYCDKVMVISEDVRELIEQVKKLNILIQKVCQK